MLDRDRRILQQADSALWDEALTAPPAPGQTPCPILFMRTLTRSPCHAMPFFLLS